MTATEPTRREMIDAMAEPIERYTAHPAESLMAADDLIDFLTSPEGEPHLRALASGLLKEASRAAVHEYISVKEIPRIAIDSIEGTPVQEFIEAERQKASNETAKAIRDECLADRDSDYIEHTNAMEIAADIAAAHITPGGKP